MSGIRNAVSLLWFAAFFVVTFFYYLGEGPTNSPLVGAACAFVAFLACLAFIRRTKRRMLENLYRRMHPQG